MSNENEHKYYRKKNMVDTSKTAMKKSILGVAMGKMKYKKWQQIVKKRAQGR